MVFAMMLIAIAYVTGCSDDDDPVDPGVITGNVDLGSSFVLELDIPVNGDIPAENLTFLRGGQVLDGTLELARLQHRFYGCDTGRIDR